MIALVRPNSCYGVGHAEGSSVVMSSPQAVLGCTREYCAVWPFLVPYPCLSLALSGYVRNTGRCRCLSAGRGLRGRWKAAPSRTPWPGSGCLDGAGSRPRATASSSCMETQLHWLLILD